MLYTLNGGVTYEEWFRLDASIGTDQVVRARLPEGTSHYLFNLVDEHRYLVSYPRMGGRNDYRGGNYSINALVN